MLLLPFFGLSAVTALYSGKLIGRFGKERVLVASFVFELVGLLVAGRLFEPTLFLEGWRATVHRCWLASQGVVADRRREDPGLWRHFELLDGLACGKGSANIH